MSGRKYKAPRHPKGLREATAADIACYDAHAQGERFIEIARRIGKSAEWVRYAVERARLAKAIESAEGHG